MKRITLLMLLLFSVLLAGCSGGTGNITGTVTWQYNKIIGTKDDGEAKVYLIPKDFNCSSLTDEQEKGWYISNQIPENSGIKFTKVDGHGNYQINKAPAGEYILLIVSAKTTRDILEKNNNLKIQLGKAVRNFENFELYVLGSNKYYTERLKIEPNNTINKNHDFGYTTF